VGDAPMFFWFGYTSAGDPLLSRHRAPLRSR
jgi:hypothetical protein